MKKQHHSPSFIVVLLLAWSALCAQVQPDLHITQQTAKDRQRLDGVRRLFFETDKGDRAKSLVQKKCIEDYGAEKTRLITEQKDANGKNYEISIMSFERDNAPVNIIYVTGYFHADTPPKEWAAPFAEIFPNYNIYVFDWPGVGESDGENKMFCRNAFGTNAYQSIQAVLEYVKKRNDKPVVLHGFCFGGAMALHATLKAQEENRPMADALGLSCIFDSFDTMLYKGIELYGPFWQKALAQLGVARGILEYMLDGSPFQMRPIDMIEQISIPCWFDYYMHDTLSLVDNGIKVCEKVPEDKRFLLLSDVGRHVRIHGKVPYQYAQGYESFLSRFIAPLNGHAKK